MLKIASISILLAVTAFLAGCEAVPTATAVQAEPAMGKI
jgi:hypothetical protein